MTHSTSHATTTLVLPVLLAHLLDTASAAPVPKAHAATHTLAHRASHHTVDVGRPALSTLASDVVVPLPGRRALDDAPAAAAASVGEQFADQGASTGSDWTKLGLHLGEGWAQGTETASNTLEQVDNLNEETHDAFATLAGAPQPPASRRNLDGMHSLPTEFADTLVDYGALGAGVGMGWITGNESPKTTVEQFAHQAGVTSDDFVGLSTGVELHLVNHTDDPTPPVRTPPQQAVDLLASASHAVVGAADSLLTGRRLEGDNTEGPQADRLTLPSPGAVAWQALSTAADYSLLGVYNGARWAVGLETPQHSAADYGAHGQQNLNNWKDLFVEHRASGDGEAASPPNSDPASAPEAAPAATPDARRHLEGNDTEGPQADRLTLPSPGAVAWQALSTAADYSLLGMYNGARWAIGLETPQHSAADYGAHGQQNLNNWKDLFVEHRASGDGEAASMPDSERAAAPDARM